MSSKREPLEPIAIIGMGLRLPGGISTPDEFWSLLINKKDGRCRVPADRYNVDAFHGDKTQRQKVATEYGYFLDNINLKALDTSFFPSSQAAQTEVTDPQQRLLLEVVWECMESAGQTNLAGSSTGVYVGVFGEDWHNMLYMDNQISSAYRVISAGDYALSNLLSFFYDLRGPSMTIRTACSASMSGLHLACQALRSGDCDTAIVAGTSIIMDPSMTLDMSEQGVLSPTGSCKTFDATADGFARGEAINAILIKPLSDALRDGDPVRAIIRSTAVNSDGRMSHMGSPSSEAQEALIRKAYAMAGIDDFSQTPFIECHGTGTPVGDPLEVAAVAGVFGGHDSYIGSVKPNVGHGEGASGITSIIKAVLSLENETIPPNINFLEPNPKISFTKNKISVPTEPISWPKNRHARISVNSFGIGGANAHVILDSAASWGIAGPKHISNETPIRSDKARVDILDNGEAIADHVLLTPWLMLHLAYEDNINEGTLKTWPRLLAVSANTEKSLQGRVQSIKKYIASRPGCIHDLAYTLGHRRTHLPFRSFCIVQDGVESQLEFTAPRKVRSIGLTEPNVAFVFTGQGAQWVGMGRGLIETVPSFMEDIRQMDCELQKLPRPPSWTIEGGMIPDDPLCTALQLALVNFFAECGVLPSAVVGHSSGEIAAAYAAGALNMSEAIICAYLRGTVMTQQKRKGSMAAIGLGNKEIQPLLSDGVQVACWNSPKSVTISGDSDAVETVLETIKVKEPDVFVRQLRVNMAYHSSHMCEIGSVYEEMLSPHLARHHEPQIPFYSTVMGEKAGPGTRLTAQYWRSNLESPVQFQNAVQAFLEEMPDVAAIVEIGPHSALQGPLRQIFEVHGAKKAPSYIPTLLRDHDVVAAPITSLGRLFTMGCAVDFAFINMKASLLTDLPNYSWDYGTNLWKESRLSRAWRLRKHAHHELLGARCLESTNSEPVWRNVFHHFDIPWLRDHKVGTNIVFPCAGYIAVMGEAIRQMLGTNCYILRNLMVKSALLLPESEPVEFITTMRPVRLTELTNSVWFEIAISISLDGNIWEENCVAQGRAGEDQDTTGAVTKLQPTKVIRPHPRVVSKSFFYERMHHAGLRYGPRFQGLDDITAHPDIHIATATMKNDENDYEGLYAVHPTTIDFCLQLCAVAGSKGIGRKLDDLQLPMDIRHIMINPGGPDLMAEATLDPISSTGNIVAINEATNSIVVKIENGRGIPYDARDHQGIGDDLHAARIEWRPDIDYFQANDLIRRQRSKREVGVLIEKGSRLSILHSLETIESLDVNPSGHLAKYVAWLKQQREKMIQGFGEINIPETQQWLSLDRDSRDSLMKSIVEEMDSFGDAEGSEVVQLAYDVAQPASIEAIFTGKTDPVEMLLTDHRIGHCYALQNGIADPSEFLQLCAHSQPTMNILEIGAGTGATTEAVLNSLISKTGARMYSRYTFTDISGGFFVSAKERFQKYGAIEYKLLDIEKDPSEQGFELASFDLIIASNGLLPGWWVGENDGRADTPYVTTDRWDKELRDAGFSGNDTLILDDDPPHHWCAHITSTAVAPNPTPHSVMLLYQNQRHEFGEKLAAVLSGQGITVRWSTLAQGKGVDVENEDVISLLDLEAPYLDDISEQDYAILLEYLSNLKSGVLWLTHPAQIGCTDPRYGLILGLARTIRKELTVDFWTVELQQLDSVNLSLASSIIQSFQGRFLTGGRKLDSEYVIRDGVIHIGRYHWLRTSQELEAPLDGSDPKQLMIDQYGLLDSLYWLQRGSVTLLEPDEVEMDIHCVGLNFRDIMMAMGLVRGEKDCLGFEAAGVITRVGTGVHHVKVGDRVSAVYSGLFATRKVLPGRSVYCIPPQFTFEEAVTLPVVYMTVVYAVIYLGQLSKGQTILIHSATGGVGQAAIHICQMLGAEIYATVGNDEKVEYLIENHSIARERIFHSRDASFLDDIMRVTNGRGVDIVLNSLSGDLLHASWSCVAKCGKMMEIGKRDILEHGHVALDMFQNNRTFYGIDLATLKDERPDLIEQLMEQFSQLSVGNHIKPVKPIHSFPATNLSEALRFMKKGQHIGKIVITMPTDPSEIKATKAPSCVNFSSTATYLLIGGLGGLGKAVTRWMVEKGARNFCFLSRSAGKSSQDQAFLKELEFQGCRVSVVAGSVSRMVDVKKAITSAPTQIAGVLQMSMVLKDLPLLHTSYADWRSVQDPKVKGTWNLHNALSGVNLDFFILFSSIAGALGHRGQANYASANSFLDSFSQYRHKLGLPCSVIQLGCMEGIGFLSDKPARVHQFRCGGVFMLQEQHLVDAIQISMQRSSPDEDVLGTGAAPRGGDLTIMSQIITGVSAIVPLSNPHNMVPFRDDLRLSMYNNIESSYESSNSAESTRDDELRTILSQAEADPEILSQPDSLERVSTEVGRTLFRFLLLPEEDMEVSMTLESIGVDSLMCIEIRNWWRRTLGCNITVLEIKNAGTIEGLGKLAISSLKKKYGVDSTDEKEVEPPK
ncbi:putative polyketide synthase [Xylariales sp. PMI_506]|nr:putative polyketide synthase [Xylariales sp. PMI_506]